MGTTELNYKVELTLLNTSYEPPSVSYGEMYSWQGNEFPKRQNQHDEVILHQYNDVIRQKRSTRQKPPSITDKLMMADLIATVVPEEGVFIIVENINTIDDYLYGSPRMPFRANRRIFVIAITKPEKRNFDKRVKQLLRRLWQEYALADVLLITPCNNDPEVSRLLIKICFSCNL